MSLPVWARDASNRCRLRMVANVVYADRLEALEACRRCPDALRVAGRCPKPKLRDLEQPNAALTSGFAGSRVGSTGYFRISGIGASSSSKARRCVGVGLASRSNSVVPAVRIRLRVSVVDVQVIPYLVVIPYS